MRAFPNVSSACVLALLLSACAQAPQPAPDCSASAQWRAGLDRRLPEPACTEAAAREAHLLGTELAGLREEFESLGERIANTAEADAAALQRRQRQLQIDIEAIESEARVQGWMQR